MIEIIEGDCRKIIPKLTRKFDLIFVDPPYPVIEKGYGEYFFDWFPLVKKVLKPTGTILMTVTQQHILPLIKEMNELPHSLWILSKRGLQTKANYPRKGHPIYRTEWVLDWHWDDERFLDRNILKADVIEPSRHPKELFWHPTPKNSGHINNMVQGLCPPNGWVLDPFLGSGTTLVICKKTGRNGVGIELSHEYCIKAKERINLVKRQLTLAAWIF